MVEIKYPYKDRAMYLRHKLLPLVKFMERRGLNFGIDSSQLVGIVSDLEHERRSLTRHEAGVLLYDAPIDIPRAGRHMTGIDRVKYALTDALSSIRYRSAFKVARARNAL